MTIDHTPQMALINTKSLHDNHTVNEGDRPKKVSLCFYEAFLKLKYTLVNTKWRKVVHICKSLATDKIIGLKIFIWNK